MIKTTVFEVRLLKKDVVAGLGEIGLPIFKILSKTDIVYGYDINPKLIPKNQKKMEVHDFREMNKPIQIA